MTNSGTLTTQPAHGGARILLGNITNTGTLAINANTSMPNSVAATLANQGALNIATGVALSASGKSTISNEAGTITATGTGGLVESGGTFNQGAGKITGTLPVVLDNTALHYTGTGTGPIAVRGEGTTLSGTMSSGQVLSIQSTCGEHARTTALSFASSGTIVLTNGDGCGDNATLSLGGGTLENKGTVSAEKASGGSRTIEGSLKNEKTVSLSVSSTLKVTGSYTQGKKGTLKTAIASGQNFGALVATGTATVGGTLQLAPAKGFVPSPGQSWGVLSGSARSGAFAKETGGLIKSKTLPGLYYKPTYSATGVSVVVTQAKLEVTPIEGLPGSTVKLSGSALPGEDKVKLTFADAKGVKTTYTSVTTNASGEYTTEVTVPAGAALGTGKFTETSTLTGVSATAAFKVT
jgi:hypothetical protein